ncbi:DUF2889 domain-containing protein [Oxalobacter aliiformigenes]|uniref:DUF2889 domain-containing protein n=1 Tax=Oxalobacter aliiformigenes TaxID=2946593 RepID=UPI0022AF3E73|nr:DUF2889 domain-containing protein [Oxalobacter aliiformigenes]MCZ4064562.1 DUF2889 domain-containing protein [Oxalobacter aliiformigenes]WAV99184.1 DUF2889 domain-containing protein [Oxalobacter aliiformigenes]
MSLPLPTTARVLKHTRTIQVQFFYRNDGLWDIDAHFTDVKTHDLLLTSVVIPAKRPVHNLWLRLTINAQGTVVDAYVAFDDVPFEGYCERIHSRYRQLIGLNVLHHFRHGLHERFKDVNGCTHMNELAEAIPSVAMQVFVFGEEEARAKAAFQKAEDRPFHLDQCHCMDTAGPAVKRFYPVWSIKSETAK